MANIAAKEPTFNLPAGSASDLYISREVNDTSSLNNGKIVKSDGIYEYPFLTRRTGDSLVGTNEEITSNEMRHGKTKGKNKLGIASFSGSLDFEFSPETFDDQLEGTFSSRWTRWTNDGESNLITKDYKTPKGYIHVNGDEGTYNQDYESGKRVTKVPLFYTDSDYNAGRYGLIRVSDDKFENGTAFDEGVSKGTGDYIVDELHIGEEPVKYSFMSRIPISKDVVRYQNYKHGQIGEMSLNVTVNAIVTGSFSMQGANNPSYFTEATESGKTKIVDEMKSAKDLALKYSDDTIESYGPTLDFTEAQARTEDHKTAIETAYSTAATKFIDTLKETTKSTSTEQFTALEGFLYVNGHQIQFASDLTMSINKNIQPVNAIFVKNAIANIEPTLDITGSITTYFTDGEVDGNGKKFGADDLKNLASENKDVEILYAVQDKENPDTIYLFQIFKATIASPSESKNADSPITLDLNYTSYGEMAVRCLRITLPKIRKVKTTKNVEQGDSEVSVKLIPNVLLDTGFTIASTDISHEVYVDGEAVEGTTLTLNASANGVITGKVTGLEGLKEDGTVTIKITYNGEEVESTFKVGEDIAPTAPVITVTDDASATYSDGDSVVAGKVLTFAADKGTVTYKVGSASEVEGSSYTTTDEDVGKKIKVKATDTGVVSTVTLKVVSA